MTTKRYKFIINVDIDDPEKPYPGGGDYTHLNRLQGLTKRALSELSESRLGDYWFRSVATLDKIIDKGEV